MSTKEIAKRNDLLRKSIPKIFNPNLLVLARGVANLDQEEVNEILKIVKVDKIIRDSLSDDKSKPKEVNYQDSPK